MLRTTPCPPKWKKDGLYIFLMEAFPEHLTPFNRLDVNRLACDIGKSYEALYQKLRKNRLNVEWAKLLCEFSNDEERLVASAREYQTAIAASNPDFADLGEDQQNERIAAACESAVAAVRKRFNGRRKPLTIEQDFMPFFI